MPIYEYECEKCGHRFEVFQSITDRVIRKCPKCGKLKLRRLIGSGAGIIFRGSGFYETDYRRNRDKPESKSETEKKDSGKKDEKKQDAAD